MTITYSCIANGRVILAELALTGGSYQVSKNYSENPLMLQEPFPPSNAIIADFQHVLGKCMMKYNQNQGEFMISALKSQVTDVKNSMSQNIDKMLKREEKLNILIDRTDNLQVATKAFQKTTTKTSKKMWWRNYKIIIIICSIFIIIIIILLSTNVIPI
uniref:Vesicle-associated membrane protein 7 n=1 Tax=Sarcophilus harrisii TaxID=9305 RepID=A0A7N4PVP3_SARHA